MSQVTNTKLLSFSKKYLAKLDLRFVAKETGKSLMTDDEHTKLAGIAAGANNYTHPTSGVTAGSNYNKFTVDANGHVTSASAEDSLSGLGVTNIDLSTITFTGQMPMAQIPQGALERLIVVADDTARFALTKSQVQIGDTVKVTATNQMYYIKDDDNLDTEAGYEVYKVGEAASVNWNNVQNKPSTFTPAAHTHTLSEITDYAEITDTEIDNIINETFAPATGD